MVAAPSPSTPLEIVMQWSGGRAGGRGGGGAGCLTRKILNVGFGFRASQPYKP